MFVNAMPPEIAAAAAALAALGTAVEAATAQPPGGHRRGATLVCRSHCRSDGSDVLGAWRRPPGDAGRGRGSACGLRGHHDSLGGKLRRHRGCGCDHDAVADGLRVQIPETDSGRMYAGVGSGPLLAAAAAWQALAAELGVSAASFDAVLGALAASAGRGRRPLPAGRGHAVHRLDDDHRRAV